MQSREGLSAAALPAFAAERIEAVPGLTRVRVPIPFPLKIINCWILADGDDWDLFDCGCDNAPTLAGWDALLPRLSKGDGPRVLFGTHGHLDHVGCTDWFVRQSRARFAITELAWLQAQDTRNVQSGGEEDRLRFWRMHGFASERAAALDAAYVVAMRGMGPVPQNFERIHDGQTVRLGRHDWQTIVAGGHAPGHAALYCKEANVLIAGDHVLPRITPVIGMFPSTPQVNPLRDYLESFPRFRALPQDVLVLPSHGEPFVGLHQRIVELEAHHAARIAALLEALDRPCTAYEAASVLFPRAIDTAQADLATGETLAHLVYLAEKGDIDRIETPDSIRFVKRAS